MELQGEETEVADSLFDIHICGACKSQFHDVENFLEHKRQCPVLVRLLAGVRRKRQHAAQSSLHNSSLPYQQAESECQQQSPRAAYSVVCESESPQLHIEGCGNQVEAAANASEEHAENLPHIQQHAADLDAQIETADEHSHQPMCLDESGFQDVSCHEHIPIRNVGDNAETEEHAGNFLYADESTILRTQTQALTTMTPDVTGLQSFSEMSPVSGQTSGSAFVMSGTVQSGQQLLAGRPYLFSSAQAISEHSLQRGNLGRQRHARHMQQLRLHHGGVHILNQAVTDEENEVQSQQLLLPISKKKSEHPVQGQTSHIERNSPVTYQFQISGQQVFEHLHNLKQIQQAVDRPSSGDLQQVDRGLVSTNQHLDVLQREADSDLGLSVSEGQDFMGTEQMNISDQDGSTTVTLDSELGRNLMRQIQSFANTNNALESVGTFIEERTLHHSVTEIQRGLGRKQRHTADDINEDCLLVKSDQNDLTKSNHLLNKWKYKYLNLMPDVSVHLKSIAGSAEEGTEASPSLQEIAAQVSEFAASLPDSLAAGQLITSQAHDTKTEVSDMGPDVDMLSDIQDQHASVLGLQTCQVDSHNARVKSPRRILHPLAKNAPARLQQQMMDPPEPSQLLSNQLSESCEIMMDTRHQRTLRKSACSGSSESHATAKSASKSSVTCSNTSTVKRKEYTCSFTDCNYVTTYVKDLQRHVRTHTGERPYTCPHCNKDFNRSDKLRVHIRWHTGDKPFKCPQCDYAAVDSSSLKKHVRTHTDERPFKCQICPYASRNSSQLIVHLRTHTGDSPFECEICGSKFKINSDLKRHMRIHTGEKPYQCELCDYKCSIKGNLKSHHKINHSPENQLQCDQCSFSSSSQKLLRQHQKQHTTGQICPVCKYVCSTSSSLKNHLRTHSDERPFQCDFCPYSAKQRGNVKSHTKKRHADKLRSLRRYRAKGGSSSHGNNSNRRSASSAAVKDSEGEADEARIQQIRPSCPRTFHCLECKSSFVRADSLRSHMRLQHRRSLQTAGKLYGSSKHQEQVHSHSNLSSMLQDKKFDTSKPKDTEMVFAPASSKLTSRRSESPGLETSSSSCASSSLHKRSRNQHGRSSSKKTLDQIADAASKLYQEQYDCKMDTSKSRLSLVSQRSKQETPQNMQFVQVLESSSGLDAATSLLASNCGDDSIRSDSGIIYVEKDGGVDSESQQISCQVFVENVVLSENQQLLNPTSQVQKVVSHILPSSSHLLYSSSSTSTSSSPSTLVTYVSSPPLNTSPGSQVTYLTSSPLQSLPMQQQAQAVSGPVVTYVIPVATDKSSQHAQHQVVPGASFVSYIASPSEMPRSQQLQVQQQQQQFQIPTSFSGQDIALVQPQNSSKNDTKFTPPVTFALTSLSLPPRTQVPGCIVSVAGNPTLNVTSSSSSTLQPVSSLSSSAPSRQHSGVRTRQKYVKPATELPSSVSLPVIISQGTASNMMAVPSTAQSSSNQLPVGGLTAFHLTSPATGTQSVQYQLQSSQPSSSAISLQPQQLQQQQQQMVLHAQPQLLLQDQQQQLQMQRTDIPVNVQVIQHGVVQQHQQHLPQHTIPINIITPVNIQQPQPPPPPPPQQQPQPTQIQIILPASAFPPPVTVNPGIGTSTQPQIILQVQEQATSHHQSPAPPPPPPPQQAPATMQEANLAVMSNGRVLSLPPSIMQSILAQLQNGAGVSLSARGDGETQGLGSVPVHIQEVVIQVDPQQLSSGLMPKHEPNGSEPNG